MAGGIKFRLVALAVAIGGILALIVWTAQSAWRRGGELRDRLTAVQLQSFQIADHFQQSVLELNNSLLRYGIYHDPVDWVKFQTASTNLDEWLDAQRPVLTTQSEKESLDLINTNYDVYIAAAKTTAAKLENNRAGPIPLADYAELERNSQTLLGLGFGLAAAHRRSMDAFLAESNQGLSYLRYVLAGAVALLLMAVSGLAAVVYRELIAPLRVRLVENQALLERQEKLASLGMLAAGVAHEIRNPLTAIKAWLFIQQKQLQPGTPEHADSEIITKEINRLERIVKDVLLFARPSEPHFSILDASEPLLAVQALLAPQLEQARIRIAVGDSLPARVAMDPQQIQQVLINLVQNAAESIGEDGTVTLRTRLEHKRQGDRLADVVVLEVADTGKGISADVEKRLFDPFFTTKETGTGLGLAIAARIVEKHGGSLRYQTHVNRGTVFGIVLPKA